MHVINELNYPSLRYYDYPSLAKHQDFAGLFRKLTANETIDIVMKHLDDPIIKMCKKLPDAFAPVNEINGYNLLSFPFFRIPKEDIRTVEDEILQGLWYVFTRMWTMYFYNKETEIIKGSTWDEMYYNAPIGYDDWLEDKMKNGFCNSGIIIRPYEQVCEFYLILYAKDMGVELSYVFHGKELVSAHLNFDGFLTSTIYVPDELERVAKHRNISKKEAYFQEDMYNILRWLFYKEAKGMVPKTIVPFKKFFDKSGYTDFRMATKTPCVIYEMPVLA